MHGDGGNVASGVPACHGLQNLRLGEYLPWVFREMRAYLVFGLRQPDEFTAHENLLRGQVYPYVAE